MEERLQKILAQAGVASRRAAEEMILAGRVTVDGRVVTELGARFDPATVEIRVNGKPIAAERHRYVILHKPAGYLSQPDPRADYPSWEALVQLPERLFPVGRLDVDSEGLLLLTNDGELANHLTHPRYEHPKTYLVEVEGLPNPRKIRRMRHGVMLDDGPTLPARVELVRSPSPTGQAGRSPATRGRNQPAGAPTHPWPRLGAAVPGERARAGAGAPLPGVRGRLPGRAHGGPGRRTSSWLRITIREGRKRQLRRMLTLLGHPALRVVRVALGPLELGDLRAGTWRDLKPGEVRALRALTPPERVADLDERTEPPSMPSIISIDGPAASGKSTVGGRLAKQLGYLYFDTGVMYRAITWVALARGVDIPDEAGVTRLAEEVRLDIRPPTIDDGRDVSVLADGVDITWDIRRPEVDREVSPVSAYPGVRKALTLQQRRIGQAGRVIMVGRDIGTVVLPEADLKIYLDASLAERARRRYAERQARGENVEYEAVLAIVRKRDEIDSSRAHAPLVAAKDAIVIDSTHMSVDEVIEQIEGLMERRKGRR